MARSRTRTKNAAEPRTPTRTPRGLDRGEILKAAFELMSQEGEAGFSVRKLGAKIGCDPMTVLHHFRSKNDLMREIADRALTSVALPPPGGDWKADLKTIASAYRDLAHRHPRLFHLHFRFHATGPMDHASSEVVYGAMLQSGLTKSKAAGIGLAFYAFVLGFALAEIEGLMLPLNAEEERELTALDDKTFPATLSLIPAFKALNPDAAFNAAIDAFIAGVAAESAEPKRASGRSRVAQS